MSLIVDLKRLQPDSQISQKILFSEESLRATLISEPIEGGFKHTVDDFKDPEIDGSFSFILDNQGKLLNILTDEFSWILRWSEWTTEHYWGLDALESLCSGGWPQLLEKFGLTLENIRYLTWSSCINEVLEEYFSVTPQKELQGEIKRWNSKGIQYSADSGGVFTIEKYVDDLDVTERLSFQVKYTARFDSGQLLNLVQTDLEPDGTEEIMFEGVDLDDVNIILEEFTGSNAAGFHIE